MECFILVFQLEVYYKVDRLLSGLTAQKKEQLFDGIQIKLLYLELFSFHHLEVCQPISRLLSCVYGMWSSMKITLFV